MDEGTTEYISSLAKALGNTYTVADGGRETAEAFGEVGSFQISFLIYPRISSAKNIRSYNNIPNALREGVYFLLQNQTRPRGGLCFHT